MRLRSFLARCVSLTRRSRLSRRQYGAAVVLTVVLSLSGLLAAATAGAAGTASIDTLVAAPGSPAAGELFFVAGGDTIWLAEPVEVVGSRVPAALPGVLRSVSLLEASALERLPGRSAAEQLATVPGVQVAQRQQYGVQADLSIRGSTFEQVQVLLDGVDVSDPQTGHHLLNLPLDLRDIARLEVLPGHGSALYGSGAFGGTVNVAVRKPGDVAGGSVSLTGGGNGTWGGYAAADLVRGGDHTMGGGDPAAAAAGPRARVSVGHFRTDGHDVENTDGTTHWSGADAENWTATARVVDSGSLGDSDVLFGYARREFGAQDFYAPYPSFERTEVLFGLARLRADLSDRVTVEPRLHVRRHEDHFVLLRDDPDAYANDHLTRRAGAELRSLVDLGHKFALVSSLEGVYEDISSTGLRGGVSGPALGEHERRRLSVACELAQNRAPLRYQLGVRLDARSGYTGHVSESAALAWDFCEHLIVRGSAGTVLRVPTFTELYYAGGGNVGNPDLEPEKGWAWDWGLESFRGPWSLTASYFERHEDDLIDWVRPRGAAADVDWRATNIAEGTTRGFETVLRWRSRSGHTEGLRAVMLHSLDLSFSQLEKTNTLPADMEGKYALISPRYQLAAAATVALPHRLQLTLSGRYVERTGGTADYAYTFVADSRLVWRAAPCSVNIQVTNLLDRRYEEIPGVQLPGRLATATVGWEF